MWSRGRGHLLQGGLFGRPGQALGDEIGRTPQRGRTFYSVHLSPAGGVHTT